MMPLWDEPKLNVGRATGMNVEPDGELCIADRQHGWLWEFIPTSESHVPDGNGASGEVGGIVDCIYADNGDIYLLFDDPPRTQRWDRQSQTLDAAEALGPGAIPIQLHWAPDGSLRVVDGARELGGAYDEQGRWVSVSGSDLFVDNQRVGTGQGFFRDDHMAPMAPPSGARYRVGPRNDGFVNVLVYWPDSDTPPQFQVGPDGASATVHLASFELATGETFMYTLPRYEDPWSTVMALVPGGPATDPWLDAATASTNGSNPDPPGASGAPSAPTGGSPVPLAEAEGCSSAPGGGRPAIWLLPLIVLVSRERERRRSRDRSEPIAAGPWRCGSPGKTE